MKISVGSSAEGGLRIVASAESGLLDSSWEANIIATALTDESWCSQAEGWGNRCFP